MKPTLAQIEEFFQEEKERKLPIVILVTEPIPEKMEEG